MLNEATAARRPLVSVIVISKDDPEGLTATLRSIAMQTFTDVEVIVVAKGSSLAAARGAAGPSTAIVEQVGSGISAAFNLGLDRARGRWINFLNGGDRYARADVLGRVAASLAEGTEIVAARAVDEKTGIRIPRDRSFAARDIELVSHQASFFDARLFERHGRYSSAYRIRMDFEWMLRLPPETATIWVDEPIVEFAGNGISTTRPVDNSLEELRALRAHGRDALRIVRLLLVYVPWRVARFAWWRLTIRDYGRAGSA